MSDGTKPPLLDRLLTFAWIATAVVAVIVWPVRLWLSSQATEVRLVTPHKDPKLLPLQKQLFESSLADGFYEGEADDLQSDLIAVYGTWSGEKESVVFADEDKIIRHPMLKGAPLLLHDQSSGNVFLLDRVRFLSLAVSIAAALAALGAWLLLRWRRRKKPATA